nr:MAG TPA: hypothetical protein [Caudoviricetes sp.]
MRIVAKFADCPASGNKIPQLGILGEITRIKQYI